MKFICDACGARYFIDDAKVRGKVLKIRCKKCSHEITVKEPDAPVPDAASPGGERQAPIRATGQFAGIAASDPLAKLRQRLAQEASQPKRESLDLRGVRARSSDSAEASTEQWHYSVNGQSFGPYSEDELLDRFRTGRVGDEAYVWQQGFSEWKPAVSIPVFGSLIADAKAAAAKRGPVNRTLQIRAIDISSAEAAAEAMDATHAGSAEAASAPAPRIEARRAEAPAPGAAAPKSSLRAGVAKPEPKPRAATSRAPAPEPATTVPEPSHTSLPPEAALPAESSPSHPTEPIESATATEAMPVQSAIDEPPQEDESARSPETEARLDALRSGLKTRVSGTKSTARDTIDRPKSTSIRAVRSRVTAELKPVPAAGEPGTVSPLAPRAAGGPAAISRSPSRKKHATPHHAEASLTEEASLEGEEDLAPLEGERTTVSPSLSDEPAQPADAPTEEFAAVHLPPKASEARKRKPAAHPEALAADGGASQPHDPHESPLDLHGDSEAAPHADTGQSPSQRARREGSKIRIVRDSGAHRPPLESAVVEGDAVDPLAAPLFDPLAAPLERASRPAIPISAPRLGELHAPAADAPSASLLLQVRQAREASRRRLLGIIAAAAVVIGGVGFLILRPKPPPPVMEMPDAQRNTPLPVILSPEAQARLAESREGTVRTAIRIMHDAQRRGHEAVAERLGPEQVAQVRRQYEEMERQAQVRMAQGAGTPPLRSNDGAIPQPHSTSLGSSGDGGPTAPLDIPRSGGVTGNQGLYGNLAAPGTTIGAPMIAGPDEQRSRSSAGPSPEHFREGLGSFVQSSIERCNQRQLGEEGALEQARVEISITVQPSGRVSAVSTDSRIRGSVFERCLQSHRERWVFPRFDGDPVTLEKTYVIAQ